MVGPADQKGLQKLERTWREEGAENLERGSLEKIGADALKKGGYHRYTKTGPGCRTRLDEAEKKTLT